MRKAILSLMFLALSVGVGILSRPTVVHTQPGSNKGPWSVNSEILETKLQLDGGTWKLWVLATWEGPASTCAQTVELYDENSPTVPYYRYLTCTLENDWILRPIAASGNTAWKSSIPLESPHGEAIYEYGYGAWVRVTVVEKGGDRIQYEVYITEGIDNYTVYPLDPYAAVPPLNPDPPSP